MRQVLLSLVCFGGAASMAWGQDPTALETVAAIKSATVYVKVPVGDKLATGSGWVMKVEGETGYLVTNHHVVADAPKPTGAEYPVVTVVFHSGTKKEQAARAEVLASQREPDLAVLKVTGVQGLPRPINFGRLPDLVETMPVFVFGFPVTGLDRDKNPPITVTKGSVSSIREDGIVQLDTNLNPGNSGGPVVDTKGRLIGIAFARPKALVKDQEPIAGIGLAIQATELTQILHGRIGHYAIASKKAYIGTADVTIEIRLIDPMEKIKAVTIHYVRADAVKGQKAVLALPEAQKVEFKVKKQQAAGTFQVSTSTRGVVSFFCQASCVNGAGKTLLADPLPFHVNFPKHAADDQGDLVVLAREAHYDGVYSVAFSPDGKTLATGGWGDDPLKLWHVDKAWQCTNLKGHKKGGTVHSVAFSPDSKMLASASRYPREDTGIRLWDLGTGKEVRRIDMTKTDVWQVAFSPDGKTLAAGGDDNEVTLWEVASGKHLGRFQGSTDHLQPIECLAFTPDGRTLATGGSDRRVRLWDLDKRKELATLAGHEGAVHAVGWTPDGKTLASASHDGTVKVWNVATRKEKANLRHKRPVQALAFNSDGTLLVSAGWDDIVRLWHVAGARELASFTHDDYSSQCVAFSPDDQVLAGRGGRGGSHVVVWRLARALEQKQGKK